MLDFFFGNTIRSVISGIVLTAVAALSVYIYSLNARIEKQKAELLTQAINIALLETINDLNSKAIDDMQKDFDTAKADLKKAQDVIDKFRADADAEENDVRDPEVQEDRIDREANGKAHEVLEEDQAQIDCQTKHFGDPSGKCVKGMWITGG